jgi:hypothetical protein
MHKRVSTKSELAFRVPVTERDLREQRRRGWSAERRLRGEERLGRIVGVDEEPDRAVDGRSDMMRSSV